MPPVASLNTAFSRARSGAEIGLAYYGSAKLTEFIKQQYGWPKVLKMLREYGQGKRTDEVVKRVLGVEPEELDRQFRDHSLKRMAHYASNFQVDYNWYYDMDAIKRSVAAHPNDAKLLGEAAVGALANRDKAGAEDFAGKALKIDPAQPQAHHVLCDIAAATGNASEAQAHFDALKAKGIDGYGLRLNLAALAKKAGQIDVAMAHLERAAALDTQQVEPHAHLAKIHLDAGREDRALDEMRAAADLDPHDRGLYRELITRFAKREQWDLVRQYGERSLWNDPLYAPLHINLAKAYSKTGDNTKAVFELESSLLVEPEDVAAVHLELGRLFLQMGQRTKALEAATRALEVDESNREAQELMQKIRGGAR
jgi:tetratricopeptide (TPR) repeat protein